MFPHDEVITIKYKHGYLRPILKNKLFPMTRNNRTQKKFQHVLQLQGELFSHVLLLVTVVTTAGNAQKKTFIPEAFIYRSSLIIDKSCSTYTSWPMKNLFSLPVDYFHLITP
ncbi:unnamed protein product [Nezara viridula]|uniref:Uncharacterized protein n=1 Tax=Nezara viridula TaxID=85310 RepID=A0A9P0H722_NEZVI|nr:unnamed protein product [Nezara viridula]